jgi:hypothetical protein
MTMTTPWVASSIAGMSVSSPGRRGEDFTGRGEVGKTEVGFRRALSAVVPTSP